MSVELLAPQNAGGGNKIIELPETTFDDRFEPRRTPDESSVVGSYAIGSGSILRLDTYHPFDPEELSDLYCHRAAGYLALSSDVIATNPHLN